MKLFLEKKDSYEEYLQNLKEDINSLSNSDLTTTDDLSSSFET
jgi:hypothetical protein